MTPSSDQTSSSERATGARPPLAEGRAALESRVGQLVDHRYLLMRLLGVGGMAAVYEAVQRDGERVAIKILHRSHATRIERRKRFLREAYLANSLRHPGVARVFADGVDHGGDVFLVMELLEGETVRALQRHAGGRVEPLLALRIADHVLDVLAIAHAHGVVHRDIKPDNLFLTADGHVKVLDFGIAHMRASVPGMTLRTLPGATIGTPRYMAPEQALGYGDVDPRSDLWALGATLYSMLSGEHLHAARARQERMGGSPMIAAPSLQVAWPDAPAELIHALDRALRLEPAERWPDARSMQRALREARQALEQTQPRAFVAGSPRVRFAPQIEHESTPPSEPSAAIETRRSVWLLRAAAAATAAAIIAAGLLAIEWRQTPPARSVQPAVTSSRPAPPPTPPAVEPKAGATFGTVEGNAPEPATAAQSAANARRRVQRPAMPSAIRRHPEPQAPRRANASVGRADDIVSDIVDPWR